MYVYVCVCVCVGDRERECVCVCMCMRKRDGWMEEGRDEMKRGARTHTHMHKDECNSKSQQENLDLAKQGKT